MRKRLDRYFRRRRVCRSHAVQSIARFDDEIEFKGTLKTTLLELFATSAPTVDQLAALPSGLHIEHSVFNAKKAMLPEWMVSAFLAYLSHHWRMSSAPPASPSMRTRRRHLRLLCRQGRCRSHHDARGRPRAVSFYFHSSHCHCTHHQTTFAPATHQTTILRLEFCGCLDCPYHKMGFASQSAVYAGTALEAVVFAQPRHANGNYVSKSECTCVFMPAEMASTPPLPARRLALASTDGAIGRRIQARRFGCPRGIDARRRRQAQRHEHGTRRCDGQGLTSRQVCWSKRGGKFWLRKRKRDDEPIRAFMKNTAKRYCHLFPNA